MFTFVGDAPESVAKSADLCFIALGPEDLRSLRQAVQRNRIR